MLSWHDDKSLEEATVHRSIPPRAEKSTFLSGNTHRSRYSSLRAARLRRQAASTHPWSLFLQNQGETTCRRVPPHKVLGSVLHCCRQQPAVLLEASDIDRTYHSFVVTHSSERCTVPSAKSCASAAPTCKGKQQAGCTTPHTPQSSRKLSTAHHVPHQQHDACRFVTHPDASYPHFPL